MQMQAEKQNDGETCNAMRRTTWVYKGCKLCKHARNQIKTRNAIKRW